jgi:hypothetical protein
MAQLAVPHVHSSFVPQDDDMSFPFGEPDDAEPLGPIELLPNPDFVFPARPLDSPPAQMLQHWNALNTSSRPNQPVSSSQPSTLRQRQRSSVSALPAFSFNPSANALQTPPHSPGLTTPSSPVTPSRSVGHRRGGSEFIGGDGQGGTGLLSSSPTKGDGILPPPPPLPANPTRLGPPPGRRGHAHRRSGAISVHDIQTILQPKDTNAQARAGSAPTTPMETEQKSFFAAPSQARRATSETCLRGELAEPSTAQSSSSPSPPRRPVSARRAVGFADRVEYIRPLSTISSETESSMSTVRGHSVTGSLSSIISAGTSSPPSARIPRTSLSITVERDEVNQRPRTASDVLDVKSKSKDGLGILTHLSHRPRSANGSPKELPSTPTGEKSPKRKSFGWWDHKSAPKRPGLPTSSSDPMLMPSSESPLPSPEFAPNDFILSDDSQANPPFVHKSRKPRKVKSWASAIISRKSKPQQAKSKPLQERAPTPPPIAKPAELDDENVVVGLDFEPDFDADNTVTIFSTPSPKRQRPNFTSESSPSKLRKTSLDDESASPVIDLDAALGPFNTPTFGVNARQPRHPPRARHSMSSMSTQAHRRTESAPELAPFEHRTSKKPTSLMEQVFEEEDEDAYERQKAEANSPDVRAASLETGSDMDEDEVAEMGIHVVERTSEDVPQVVQWESKDASPWRETYDTAAPLPNNLLGSAVMTATAEHAPRPVSPFSIPVREPTPVEVVEAEEEPRASSLTKDSDSTITPSISPDGSKEPQPLMTLSLPIPQHSVMTPDTLSGSSFSGRDFTTSSQASIDTPRLGTATSTGTENRSISFGEPGPEVRMSYEDVPSLTSSRSTMTSPAQHPWARPSSAFMPDDPRSMSFSLPPGADNRKRSSIASLSRLIGGGSFGERSKLSIESRPQSQHSSATGREVQEKRKSKRLSKLVNFFRPKHNEAERS